MGILPQSVLDRFKPRPLDVVGLDITKTGIGAVRIRKTAEGLSLVAADLLPLPEAAPDGSPGILVVPPRLKARYASLTTPGAEAVVKLMSFPGAFDAAAEAKLVDSLGVENPDSFRIGYKVVTEGHGKGTESRVLAVAVPDAEAAAACQYLPAGLPVPFSVEISGLATMTAFGNTAGQQHASEAVAALEFGTNRSFFALFNKGILSLIRVFDVGTDDILTRVQETLGVDAETAHGIITDGAFDTSQSVNEVMEPVIKQIVVSRDFVERHENCHVLKMYISGGFALSKETVDDIRGSMGVDVGFWNPIEGMNALPDAVPETVKGREWRLTAAVGSVMATFEETAA